MQESIYQQVVAALGPILEKYGLAPATNAGGFASERVEVLLRPGGTMTTPYEGEARITLVPGWRARGTFRSRTLAVRSVEDMPAFVAQVDNKLAAFTQDNNQ